MNSTCLLLLIILFCCGDRDEHEHRDGHGHRDEHEHRDGHGHNCWPNLCKRCDK